jgi:hypothetical protein
LRQHLTRSELLLKNYMENGLISFQSHISKSLFKLTNLQRKKMPFGGHIADVARQGFWASLTGGWYYEPAHSLFCNTLHLYIWTILFLLPILFGLYSTNQTGQISLGLALGYAAILCGIFVLIKLIVSWLHHIFDTVQPIKYKSKRSVNSRHEEQTNQQVFFTIKDIEIFVKKQTI